MSLKQLAFKGFLWTYAEKSAGQIINFFVNILLARKLFPSDFGVLGILFVFITISNVLVDGGMTASLIRKKDVSDTDISTVFFANILFSFLLYALIFFTAPFIADFYDQPKLIAIIRVFSLTIVFQAFVVVQSAILIKNMNFRLQTFMKIPSIIISSVIGIVMAFWGYGVWSLVWMYVSQAFFWSVFHWLFSDCRPKLLFDKLLFKYHFNFGYKLSLIEILNAIIANVYQLFIGKFYSILNVGYYTQSLTLRQLPISNIYGPASKLFLPIFSKIQDDEDRLITTYKQILAVLIVVIAPILTFLAVFSEPIMVLLYSEKWRVAAPFLFHLAIAGVFSTVSSFNLSVLNVVGGSRLLLKIEFLNKIQIVVFVVATVLLGLSIHYLLYTISFSAVVSYFIVSYFTAKYLKIKIYELLYMMFRLLSVTFISVLCAYLLYKFCFEHIFMELFNAIISCLFGVVVYMLLTFFFNKIVINSLVNFLKHGK